MHVRTLETADDILDHFTELLKLNSDNDVALSLLRELVISAELLLATNAPPEATNQVTDNMLNAVTTLCDTAEKIQQPLPAYITCWMTPIENTPEYKEAKSKTLLGIYAYVLAFAPMLSDRLLKSATIKVAESEDTADLLGDPNEPVSQTLDRLVNSPHFRKPKQ